MRDRCSSFVYVIIIALLIYVRFLSPQRIANWVCLCLNVNVCVCVCAVDCLVDFHWCVSRFIIQFQFQFQSFIPPSQWDELHFYSATSFDLTIICNLCILKHIWLFQLLLLLSRTVQCTLFCVCLFVCPYVLWNKVPFLPPHHIASTILPNAVWI